MGYDRIKVKSEFRGDEEEKMKMRKEGLLIPLGMTRTRSCHCLE